MLLLCYSDRYYNHHFVFGRQLPEPFVQSGVRYHFQESLGRCLLSCRAGLIFFLIPGGNNRQGIIWGVGGLKICSIYKWTHCGLHCTITASLIIFLSSTMVSFTASPFTVFDSNLVASTQTQRPSIYVLKKPCYIRDRSLNMVLFRVHMQQFWLKETNIHQGS